MIILLGPDNSGKSTLAQHLVVRSVGTPNAHTSFKSVALTGYKEYIEFLRGPKTNVADLSSYKPGLALAMDGQVVCDRFFYCEVPYAKLFRKLQRTQFTLKQWHNMHLSTIAFNPVVVLATRRSDIAKDDIVPEELFYPILEEYKTMLAFHRIKYYTYDYEEGPGAQAILQQAKINSARAAWWIDMARSGVAGIGNTVDPKVLIMAQDLGPSNIHRIAFEQGPSGYYLSDLIDEAEIPLNSFYLTNWLKTTDKDRNVDLLNKEMEGFTVPPSHVVLLGREAEATIPLLANYMPKEFIHTVRHPGWVVNHAGTIKELNYRKEKYLMGWLELWKTILS